MMKLASIVLAIALLAWAPMIKANDYADLVITEHNKARSHFGAPHLTWSVSLAGAAQEYANQCIWEHDQFRGDDIGENLGQSGDGNGVPIQYVVSRWESEYLEYDYDYDYPEEDEESFKKIGHFSQLVWLDTKQVGCGQTSCSNLGSDVTLVVCRYFPSGNYPGEFRTKVLRHI
ncbi:hypothetical protein BGZ82_010362 [Podila clonocystis]|nr:hypothetical protein BGZ82_010362 [Podila clonocystis]